MKYCYAVDIGLRCRELLREIARSQEMSINAGSINLDPVHLLVGIPPQLFCVADGAMPEGEKRA